METEHSSIEIWLESTLDLSDHEDDIMSIDLLTIKAGSGIFNCPISTVADLASTVASEMDIQISSLLPGIHNISKLCLLHAVSSKCARRAEYVQGIIALDPVIQGELMQIIKRGMTQCIMADDNDEKDDIIISETHSEPVAPSRKRDREADIDCSGCHEKDKEISHLQASIRRAVCKEEEDAQQYQHELSIRDSKLMDADLQLMKRDERIRNQQKEVEQNQLLIREQQLALQEISKSEEKIKELQDEIDILKPRSERLESVEASKEKLKLKLDEMADLKEQLAAEGAAHLKTQNKYVDLVREVDSLRKAKTHLDEYRSKCAELEISKNELSVKLVAVTKEFENASGRNTDLSESQRDKIEETSRLLAELEATQARLREVERSGGVGQGMSELNPELMFELTSLRSENETLVRQINKSSLESLENLEKELDHAKTVNMSLQSKWLETKDALARANNEILSLNQNILDWTQRHEFLSGQHDELEKKSHEDRLSLIERNESLFRDTKMKHSAELNQEITTREAIIENVKVDLENKQNEFKTVSSYLAEKTLANEMLTENLNSANKTVLEREEEISALMRQHEVDVESAKENHAAIVELLKDSERNKLQELIRKHEAKVKLLEIDISSASSELDDEKKKRRRIEREKRHLVDEVHRYKTQAQINSTTNGSSNHDLSEILKEMKTMQRSLDNLTQENVNLKNQAISCTMSSEPPQTSTTNVLKGGAGRVLPSGTQLRSKRQHPSDCDAGTSNVAQSSSNAASYTDYLEQTDITDKRIEQLVREKREIMAKHLEESKEKMELAQKLLQSERDNTQMKSKITKLTLDNERYQRKVALGPEKAKSLIARAVTEENIPNLKSNYPRSNTSAL